MEEIPQILRISGVTTLFAERWDILFIMAENWGILRGCFTRRSQNLSREFRIKTWEKYVKRKIIFHAALFVILYIKSFLFVRYSDPFCKHLINAGDNENLFSNWFRYFEQREFRHFYRDLSFLIYFLMTKFLSS